MFTYTIQTPTWGLIVSSPVEIPPDKIAEILLGAGAEVSELAQANAEVSRYNGGLSFAVAEAPYLAPQWYTVQWTNSSDAAADEVKVKAAAAYEALSVLAGNLVQPRRGETYVMHEGKLTEQNVVVHAIQRQREEKLAEEARQRIEQNPKKGEADAGTPA